MSTTRSASFDQQRRDRKLILAAGDNLPCFTGCVPTVSGETILPHALPDAMPGIVELLDFGPAMVFEAGSHSDLFRMIRDGRFRAAQLLGNAVVSSAFGQQADDLI